MLNRQHFVREGERHIARESERDFKIVLSALAPNVVCLCMLYYVSLYEYVVYIWYVWTSVCNRGSHSMGNFPHTSSPQHRAPDHRHPCTVSSWYLKVDESIHAAALSQPPRSPVALPPCALLPRRVFGVLVRDFAHPSRAPSPPLLSGHPKRIASLQPVLSVTLRLPSGANRARSVLCNHHHHPISLRPAARLNRNPIYPAHEIAKLKATLN